MADIARVQQEFGRRRQSIDFVHSRPERAGNVRIRRLVESHMAVADLHETQLSSHLLRVKFTATAHAERLQYAALHHAQCARSGPGHTFEKTPPVDSVVVVIVYNFLTRLAVHILPPWHFLPPVTPPDRLLRPFIPPGRIYNSSDFL